MVDEGATTDIYIYGDITSYPWDEADVDSYSLAKSIEASNASSINVFINSYGGEVAEGVAIHNALKRHEAKVTTYCDGFACSAASVVFMAGDERVMYPASLLMIHNAWTWAVGNASELRKEADDLEKISQAASNAYKQNLTITDEELAELLDNESWLDANEAFSMGFSTMTVSVPVTAKASQSVRSDVSKMIIAQAASIKKAEIEAPNEIEEEPEIVQQKPKKQLTLFSFVKGSSK